MDTQTVTSPVENEILTRCIDRQIPVTVYTINGFQMRGLVLHHDEYVIQLKTEDDGKEKMIYKSAISTIGLPKS